MRTIIRVIFLLLFCLPCSAKVCAKTFAISYEGITRFEHLFGQTHKVLDRSHLVRERQSLKAPDLKVINITDAFSPKDMLLGFGKPNVFLTLPRENQTPLRFAAKSLKRAKSKLEDTKGRMQSGVFIALKNVDPQITEQVMRSATEHVGTKRWTCVNATCRVLHDAGFTSGGKPIDDIYFPVSLLRRLMGDGLEHNGRPVEFDLVRTSPTYLERFALSVIKSQWLTMCRHTQRKCSDWTKQQNLVGYLARIKNGSKDRVGAWFVKESKDDPRAPEITTSKTEKDYGGPTYQLSVSQPSGLGILLRTLWGPHSLFEIDIRGFGVEASLPDTLKEFSMANPSLATKIKRDILFSKPIVNAIRSQLSRNYQRFDDIHQHELFDMIRQQSGTESNRYNVVITTNRIIVLKNEIQNPMVDWILSKHVLLSNYSERVRFAGEIWRTADGEIYINNNSGTYQPSRSQLLNTVEFLNWIFPDITVVAEPVPE